MCICRTGSGCGEKSFAKLAKNPLLYLLFFIKLINCRVNSKVKLINRATLHCAGTSLYRHGKMRFFLAV